MPTDRRTSQRIPTAARILSALHLTIRGAMAFLIRTACIIAIAIAAAAPGGAQVPSSAGPASGLSCEEMERFLKTAKIVSMKDLDVGVTVPRRATLSDGQLTHDAA